MVRTKMRCMGINARITETAVELQPVIGKSKDWPGGCEENRQFWDATPAGEVTLWYQPYTETPFRVGAYYYLDLEEIPAKGDRTWKLWEVAETESQQTVKFGMSWDNTKTPVRGDFQMTINNRDAWKHFGQKAGTHWRVSISDAPGPETNQATYP